MNILIAASEVYPYAKTGGLADVTGALPKALKKLGHHPIVFMPRYACVDPQKYKLTKVKDVFVPISSRLEKGEIYQGEMEEGIPFFLIEKKEYYQRAYLYGNNHGDYPDNAERFIFFSRAILEAIITLNLDVRIIHCNDWQTGLIPVYLKTIYSSHLLLKNIKTVFTIHNIGYQGLFWHLDMPLTNLSWDIFNSEGIEFYGKINMLKAGLIFSDIINTVSPTYCQEIKTPEFGYGLDGVLRKRSDSLFGIVNGVDYELWDPAIDKFINMNYDFEHLRGKKECKKELLNIFGLDRFLNGQNNPVLGLISRMADQKGFDLLSEIIEELMDMDVYLIILGMGDQKYHDLFTEIGEKYPQKAGVRIGFDHVLAHKIIAGSDIFLMPSRYEPCGLNQMYSLKYGTIPVVRATGGLNDTIIDQETGFKFKEYSAEKFLEAITKSLGLYQDQSSWCKIMGQAMRQDFSWNKSAREYLKLYEKIGFNPP